MHPTIRPHPLQCNGEWHAKCEILNLAFWYGKISQTQYIEGIPKTKIFTLRVLQVFQT